ncbi:aromatic-ring-hydroxylating dioxygenase subunit beta [Hydrogenibacillus sp. N12]|uniref:aromatic-ring-hydroxylating dioxygenase subunit beta n=1 Tax=Hydrogenibacillus sp. N12 TaxID=2866627 RepID=UPI001C7C9E12|nr:aromatic-ring-hydroxylating dioxygenase subunit beta [Hydrogenibacillus sp. N12]QZA33834.1 aromatic-ring-hydroxylating dioxygenase subunit beta [Hydrogenibacillus sp. N12]
MGTKTTKSIQMGDAIYFEILDFLHREAALLDDGRFRDWLALMDPDVRYTMPIRTTRERVHGDGFVEEMYFFDENYASLKKRVDRLETEYAWGEDPPSRTRRFIDNVRIEQMSDAEFFVRSYFLLMRSRGNNPAYSMLTGVREDTLVKREDSFRLKKRKILIDQATLGMENLGVFF